MDVLDIYYGFMTCLKIPNKEMCDTCNYKKKGFRQCAKCKHKLCFDSRIITKTMLIHVLIVDIIC